MALRCAIERADHARGADASIAGVEMLARQTGGASFSLKDMRKTSVEPPGPRIFDVLRAHYTLTLAGNLSLGEKVKVEIKRPEKLFASVLPLE